MADQSKSSNNNNNNNNNVEENHQSDDIGPVLKHAFTRERLGPRATTAPASVLYSIKDATTISMLSHTTVTAPKAHPRARSVLMNRGPSYPALAYDVSLALIEETERRKKLHGVSLSEHWDAFRKKMQKENTSDFFHQRHLVRDYLLDMHPYLLEGDIGTRVYTVSRLKQRERAQEAERAEQAAAVAAAAAATSNENIDFVQPKDPVRPRTTGYSPGHIRTVLGLDTFGPSASKELSKQREKGERSTSPNPDRYNLKTNKLSKTRRVIGRAISPEDRLSRDPHLKSIDWYKSYKKSVDDKKSTRRLKQLTETKKKTQQREVRLVYDELDLFDRTLTQKKAKAQCI